MPDPANALAFYVVFLFSTTLHEAAHAWAAKLGGDLTAYHGGQVTLDPRPHIRREPFGMVILPLLTVFMSGWPFGFASAPYDRQWAVNHPRRAAWMALAGPGANLLLVLVAVLLIRLGVSAGVFFAPPSVGFDHVVATHAAGLWPAVALLLSVFFSLNLVLAALNILPLPPLDGSAAIMLFMDAKTAPKYQQFLWGTPMLQWIGMLVAWQVFGVLFNPVFLFAVNFVYPGLHYG